jgi:DNA-directed RNA polymerase subunit beta'
VTEKSKDEEGQWQNSSALHETTVGRALVYEIVPDGIPYAEINKTMVNKDMSRLINLCYRSVGLKETGDLC